MHATTSNWSRTGRWAATVVLLVATGLLTACSGSDSEPETKPTVTATSSSDEPDTGEQEDQAEDTPSDQGSGTPTGTRPKITSFSTPESIDCHNGNFQEFTASWATKNATKTTISIDGAGIYKTYGRSGSESLPFSCGSPHTFLLTAYDSAGHKATQSITLKPRNVQQDSGDDDENEDDEEYDY